MATILTRKRADGLRFTARIRLTRDGKPVYTESQTFSTKTAAREWARRREVELEDPKLLVVATSGGLTLAALIRWYIDTYESLSQWQRSKQSALKFLERHPIGQQDPFALTTDILITHIQQRRLSGLSPSSAANVWSANSRSGPQESRQFVHAHASEYSWCNPPSIGLAWTKRKSSIRCREMDNGAIEFGGGSGTPGPNAECGRPRL
jgi:hypothetical protein